MVYKYPLSTFFLLMVMVASIASCEEKPRERPPNILIIYADDMGYGDLNIQNPDSKIPTPHLDQLAAEGMRFTDAHSSSGICSPSRYALLTGTYHWRRQHGIVDSFGKPFFNDSDITLPQVLRDGGYRTACIGKWHLGWDWVFENPPSGKINQWGREMAVYHPDDINWNLPVRGGPVDRGFDYYFGDGTINFPPYAWMENDRFLEAPTEVMYQDSVGFKVKEGQWEFRPGPKVKGWNPYDVLPTLTKKAVEWIKGQDGNKPFFLYFPLTSPHAPIIPNEEFDGKSQAGAYGDFVYQSDWIVGQVLYTIREMGFEDNTIVLFTADNGPESYAFSRAEAFGHFSMGELRGLKRDVWEGGHRVPFVIKWPERIVPGVVSDKLVSQIDVMATLLDLVGITPSADAAPDSFHFLPELGDSDGPMPQRTSLIHNTNETRWAVRDGDWLYINDSTGQHTRMPESFFELRGYPHFGTSELLFNLSDDPGQFNNLSSMYPERLKEMQSLLSESKAKGYFSNRE